MELRQQLLDIAKVARSLNRQVYPNAAKLIRLTTSRGYYPLRFDAMNFLKVLPDMEQEFIDREFPEDFIAELQKLLDRFDQATLLQTDGRLYAVSRLGMAIVMELDAQRASNRAISS